MTPVLLIVDEEEDLLEPYQGLGLPLAWVGHKQQYSEALAEVSAFVVQDPAGDRSVLPDVRRHLDAQGLEVLFVCATSESNVPKAVGWAEALGSRGPCPSEALPFFYDKFAMRERLGDHPWNLPHWLGSDLRNLQGGPFIVKPRQGESSKHVTSCADRTAVEALLHGVDNPDDWVVEHKAEGMEFVLDGFLFDGVFRLTGLHRTFTGLEGTAAAPRRNAHPHIESAHLSGPLFAEAHGLALAAGLGAVLRGQGLTEGMFHTEFRLDGEVPKLIETHPRPGGGSLPLLGEITGCHSLETCFSRLVRREAAPADRYPSSWHYQRFLKGVPLDEAAREALAQACPGITFLPLSPLTEGPVVTQSNDWDLCLRVGADTWGAISGCMQRIEAVLARVECW